METQTISLTTSKSQPLNGSASAREWHMPGSILSVLWGRIMPRLAARMWRTEFGLVEGETRLNLRAFDLGATGDDLRFYPLEGTALEDFWKALAEVTFGPKGHLLARSHLSGLGSSDLTNGQRAALSVLEYFDPERDRTNRMPIRIIDGESYDFILHSGGLDVFVPPNPANTDGRDNNDGPYNDDDSRRTALAEIFRMYRFRATGTPPIGLPGLPATSTDPNKDYLIPTIQLNAPTGVSLANEKWIRASTDLDWWITGAAYRGIMTELPRIIASLWHEQVLWPEQRKEDSERTYSGRFKNGLKRLLEERLETRLPEKMHVRVGAIEPSDSTQAYQQETESDPTDSDRWNPRDVMITNAGLVIPGQPTDGPPQLKDVLIAIEKGVAGNPVFTDSGIPPE